MTFDEHLLFEKGALIEFMRVFTKDVQSEFLQELMDELTLQEKNPFIRPKD